RNDGVHTCDGPVHARALAASADGHFAAGLDNTGGSAKPCGAELRVAHAVAVVLDVLDAVARLLVGWRMGPQSEKQGLDLAGVQLLVAVTCPFSCQVARRAVDGFADI